MKTLLLWDIDGTLLASGGAGVRALTAAFRDTSGLSDALDGVDWPGRTDAWILRTVCERHQIASTASVLARTFDAYIAHLPAELDRSASVLPGVREILTDAAGRPDVTQGLLTGNFRRGAQTKLEQFGLWSFFAFGGFSDDDENRNGIGPHALRRAGDHAGVTFAADRVWVIGDTPHDIACGRAIGARTLAVASGHCAAEELARHAPTAQLDTLADPAAFWRVIEQSY